MSAADELGQWDAVETAERIAARDVGAEEVLEAAIARAEAAAGLGAIVTPAFDRARAQAVSGPFAGVPSFIKDLTPIEGVRMTWGSRAAGHHVPTRTGEIARRHEALGLVTLGKSATSEIGLTATTESLGFPPCRNPWDPSRSSGGSSGGAASLVAAGVVPIAHAADGGGSIRIPSSCCGLVGFKPSRHRQDMEGSSNLPVNIAVDGVVTRTVRDTVAFWNELEARHAPRRVRPIGPVPEAPERPLRVGFYTDHAEGRAEPETRAAVERAARWCEELGHHVEAIDNPYAPSVNTDFTRLWGLIAFASIHLGGLLQHRGWDKAAVEPWTSGLAQHFWSARGESFSAIRRLRALGRDMAHLHRTYDVLVSPTLAAPAPALGHLSPDLPFWTKYERLQHWVPFTPVHNVLGLPAVSLPLGRTEGGLPIGVLFATAWDEDARILALARQLEAAHPWPLMAPAGAWRDA